ncbi:Calcium-transporting ATPase 1 [Platysternon megacephalum]|uniref:P-type Ca(2+) transporter n=1 Tax=Platysternon megacephalum TaxID=55544 RepID=A0A4D9DF39_9SAUR|nr:Calcium-transporting ATPase 1 [Platysternon megacephalum]
MTSRELLDIIRRNVIQPVVIAIYTLAAILLWLGEYRDALFMSGVITVNTIFGIVQEIRAKLALHKLELMNQPIARIALPDGQYEEVPYDSLTVGMTLVILSGDEIPADGDIVESHGLEVNESMLTGESLPIPKPAGSTVLSSTSVIAGSAVMNVMAVGLDTAAGKMTSKLKAYKPEMTPLLKLINQVIFYLTFVAVALIALIGLVYWSDGYKARTIFKTITSAGITVIPEGLLLASTVLLAFGSLKLAAERVLPQKLSAIEGMALLDVLCTDKTGTLTSETITLDRVETLGD